MNKGKIQKGKLVRTSEDVRECSGDIRKLVRMVTSAYRRCGGIYRGEMSELEMKHSEEVRTLGRIGKCSGDIRKLFRTGCPLTSTPPLKKVTSRHYHLKLDRVEFSCPNVSSSSWVISVKIGN